MQLGDFRPGDTVDFQFTTSQNGVPTTLAGTPVVSIYKDNSTTESTAGVTLTVDHDARTGKHHVRITTGTDGTFYSSASEFTAVITTGTVGGLSVVGTVIAAFSLEKRSALRPATAGRQVVIDAAGLADANVVKLGPTGAGTAQTARDIGASVLLSAGAGAGQLDFTAGVVKANLAQILGTALTETAGLLAGGFKKFFNVATPTGTLNDLPGVAPNTNGGLALVDANLEVKASTLRTNNDKTGYALTQVFPANFAALVIDASGNVKIQSSVKRNTAFADYPFLMTDATTHAPVTGKAVTVTRLIDSGVFGAGTLSAVTEIGFGLYKVSFANADLNGAVILLRATAAGCDDTVERIFTFT